MIFWFTDSAASCADKTRPWYEAGAAAGDPDALYNLGKSLDRAGTDPRRAQALLRAAAEQGSFTAQNDLGAMLLAGRGCVNGEPRLEEAELWFAGAAGKWKLLPPYPTRSHPIRSNAILSDMFLAHPTTPHPTPSVSTTS